MSDAAFTPLRGAPDAQGYPTLPQEPTYGYNDRRNFLTPPPRSSFAEPARAAECFQLGAPRDTRRYLSDPLPLWRDITLFLPGRLDTLLQRRDGLARLSLWIFNWLFALLAERGGKPHDPYWEPTRELAEVLGLPEAHLNRLCREHDGLSARDLWDKLRFRDFKTKLRQEIERMLDGRSFTPARRKTGKPDRFGQLQRALRSARRQQGWTRLEFAWQMGYTNFARLNLAAFRSEGQSVQALEAAILRDLAATWYFDDTKCVVRREYVPDDTSSIRYVELVKQRKARNKPSAPAIYDHKMDVKEPDPYMDHRPDAEPPVCADEGPGEATEDAPPLPETQNLAEAPEADAYAVVPVSPEADACAAVPETPEADAYATVPEAPEADPCAAVLEASEADACAAVLEAPEADAYAAGQPPLDDGAAEAPASKQPHGKPERARIQPPPKGYPHVAASLAFALFRPRKLDETPPRFSEGRPELSPHRPPLGSRRQYEALTLTGRRVRVFANAEEVWKFFLFTGWHADEVEQLARRESRSLDDFLEAYVRHGMVVPNGLFGNDLDIP